MTAVALQGDNHPAQATQKLDGGQRRAPVEGHEHRLRPERVHSPNDVREPEPADMFVPAVR